jgi:membrane protein
MNAKQALDTLGRAVSGWVDDRASSMGAALAYYTVFSIAPLLVIVIAVAGLVYGAQTTSGAIVAQLQGLLGDQAAQTIEGVLSTVSEPKKSAAATVIGFLTLLLGATTVFAELQDDLNRIWKVPARAKPKGVWGWVRARILSFGMILAIGFVLLASLVASAAIAAVGKWGGSLLGGWEVLAHVVEVLVSFGLLTVLFAVLYRYLPDVHIAWHDVWTGALATALLFSIGKLAIGLYIGKSSTASAFGAAGSLVVVLLWVYYSAQIFLFGAEFTAAYSHAYGSRRRQAAVETGAAPGVEPSPKAGLPTAASPPLSAGPAAARKPPGNAPPTPALLAPARPDTPEPHGITAPIARHPAGAIGLAAGLGAAAALLVRRWQRRNRTPRPLRADAVGRSRQRAVAVAPARGQPQAARRTARSQGVRAARSVAKAIASAALTIVTRALAERLKRGARRGWRTGKARAA